MKNGHAEEGRGLLSQFQKNRSGVRGANLKGAYSEIIFVLFVFDSRFVF